MPRAGVYFLPGRCFYCGIALPFVLIHPKSARVSFARSLKMSTFAPAKNSKRYNMAGQKTPTALGTENIGKLLMQYAVPAIIAMTASSLYNMVDSIFIGHGVGTMAISGLALTFPLMNLAAAFGSLVGVGASTLISVRLGQKDYDTAQRVLGNVFVLNILLGVAFTVVVMAFLDLSFTSSGGATRRWGMRAITCRLSCWVTPLRIFTWG